MGLLDKLVVPGTAVQADDAWPTLDVTGASDAQVLGTLASTFGADDACTGVQVLCDGELLGTVPREAASAAVGDGMKGIGASDGMLLPGIANYTTSSWYCPRPGCRYTLVSIVLGDTPTCARHPDQPLVLQP